MKKLLYLALISLLFIAACGEREADDSRPFIVTTTMMLEDTVKQIAGEYVNVTGLMGPGVDPHLYRATPRDIRHLDRADLIIYNGLYLEARLSEILDKMDKNTYAAAQILPERDLIQAYEYGGTYDPHVWFDVSLWATVVEGISLELQNILPEHQEEIQNNTRNYLIELAELHNWVHQSIQTIPEKRRVLITAHDAFRYFGKAYDIKVMGLQGLSTQSEVGLQDISHMVRFIIDNEIPAIFLESSIAPRSIQSLINGVSERGGHVELGGELFSDAMGARDTPEATYTGMVRFNVTTITEALK